MTLYKLFEELEKARLVTRLAAESCRQWKYRSEEE